MFHTHKNPAPIVLDLYIHICQELLFANWLIMDVDAPSFLAFTVFVIIDVLNFDTPEAFLCRAMAFGKLP